MRTYTAFVAWQGDDIEEIDVEARNAAHAHDLVEKELEEGYEPGGVILRIVPLEESGNMVIWR